MFLDLLNRPLFSKSPLSKLSIQELYRLLEQLNREYGNALVPPPGQFPSVEDLMNSAQPILDRSTAVLMEIGSRERRLETQLKGFLIALLFIAVFLALAVRHFVGGSG